MMNGSEPCGPSSRFPGPSPKRRWPRLRVSCSPSPQPSPSGEGETFARALVIRPSLVVVCLRTDGQISGTATATSEFSSAAQELSLSLRERVGVHCRRIKATRPVSLAPAGRNIYSHGITKPEAPSERHGNEYAAPLGLFVNWGRWL